MYLLLCTAEKDKEENQPFLRTMAGVLIIMVSHESDLVGERQRGGEVGG